MINFLMPSLGADMEAGTLVEWKKKPGDSVSRGDIIAEVETQKGLIEIEVFEEGIIEELIIKEGSKVPVGTIMALIKPVETIAETSPTSLQPMEESSDSTLLLEKTETRKYKASPLAKKIANANKIDLSSIMGTGEAGVITKEDVELAMIKDKKRQQQHDETPEIQELKKTPQKEAIRNAVAAAMSKSNKEIPHYYLKKKIDMTKTSEWLLEANKKRNIKERLLPVALLIKAVAQALLEYPDLNAVWENGLQIKKQINIGFVVSLRLGGIIVPTIHQADVKTIDEIMIALNDIIPRARALNLRSSELSDSTITITNIGEEGADTVFGLIYPPQVAIIGFGSSSKQPFTENGMLGVRSMINVTLAGDHRATDGLLGSRFLMTLNNNLQNPQAL